MLRFFSRIDAWIEKPVSVLRIEIIRIGVPLMALGFMSDRIGHADELIGDVGFHPPHIPGDYRQPIEIPPLTPTASWIVAGLMIATGFAASLGFKARVSSAVFAALMAFVAIADPLSSFTVSKITPVIMFTVALAPAGTRLSIDAWQRARRGAPPPDPMCPGGPLRFLQVFMCVFYFASGVAKFGGDWADTRNVLWTHLHDTYQTDISYWIGRVSPAWVWTPLQVAVLSFELLAPVWFSLRWTRQVALVFGLGMHFMIAIMFGPVIWFGFLMMFMLLGTFLPDRYLARLEPLARRLETSPPAAVTRSSTT